MLSWQRTLKSTSVLGNIWGRKHATEGLVYKNTARKHHPKVGQPGKQPSQTLRPSRKKVLYSIHKRVEKPANCVSKVSVWNRECKSERPCDELRSPVPSWTRQLQLQTLALQKGTAKTAKKSMDASRQAFDLLLPFCFCWVVSQDFVVKSQPRFQILSKTVAPEPLKAQAERIKDLHCRSTRPPLVPFKHLVPSWLPSESESGSLNLVWWEAHNLENQKPE